MNSNNQALTRQGLGLMSHYIERSHAEVEDALVTACSCVAAGVPISDVFVQQYQESSILNSVNVVTIVGFLPMTPVKACSAIYRLI